MLSRILAARSTTLRCHAGCSLIELAVVLVVAGEPLGLAVGAYGVFRDATSARRAAETWQIWGP